ncbi:MAG: 1,2-phenylacetyl-CoA epoxidase subunit A [Alicyclobacillaceae bacterium]|nr:1,2-phenylacetyl-CoA epoxidase subunit A [Alicyclobacillaceae bacterium]
MTGYMTEQEFYRYVENGGKVDATDPMPEAYKREVARIMSFQALAEIVGTLLSAEWVPKAPSVIRKMMYTAKAQDEMGHAHILIRQCEDIGVTREQIIEEYLAGKRKLLNIFHYGFDRYEEMVVGMLMQNTGAIVQFQSLVKGSYLPYIRALRKIMKEESFHYNLAVDMVEYVTKNGTNEQRQIIQEAIDTWYPRMLAYFGPPEKGEPPVDALRWRIKCDTNDDVREAWLEKIVPLISSLGYTIHDPLLKKDERTGRWSYTEPDWEEVRRVINDGGPRSAYWKEKIRKCYEETRWVRDVVSRYSAGQAAAVGA